MGLATPDRIRTLQRKLYVKAKGEPRFRFYLLYDKVWRTDILEHAYRLCRENGGAAGVDGETFEGIESREGGLEGWLGELAEELREERYRPQAVRRVMIPKPDGGERPLGIPTIRDRVAQQAAKLVIEPIFEADFEPNAYGYRPGRGALDAVNEVRTSVLRGESQVVDADFSKYFDTIPHPELMKSVARRISDRKMLHLIKMWLKAPVEEMVGKGRKTLTGGGGSKAGTPQGGVLSPLLVNIYIHRLLKAWKRLDLEAKLGARIINYADDLVILSRNRAEEALNWLRWITGKMGLSLNEAKTRVCDAGQETFDFLGYTFGPMVFRRTGRTYIGVTPSKKRVKRFKQSLRAELNAGNHAPLEEVVAAVNRKLLGWGRYFSVGTLEPAYRVVDRYTEALLRQFLARRHKVPGRGNRPFSYRYLYDELGLVRLQDRRRMSRLHALTWNQSESRMRENRTSGSMSGSEKPGHGRASEALPEETGSQRIGPAYCHGAWARLYPSTRAPGREGIPMDWTFVLAAVGTLGSLIAACAAWAAAREARRAAEGQVFSTLFAEYGQPEMLRALRVLRNWQAEKGAGFETQWKKALDSRETAAFDVDAARRLVQQHFLRALGPYEAGYASRGLLRSLCAAQGINTSTTWWSLLSRP